MNTRIKLFAILMALVCLCAWGAGTLTRGPVTTSDLAKRVLTNETPAQMLAAMGASSNLLYDGSVISNVPFTAIVGPVLGTAAGSNSSAFQAANGRWSETNFIAAGAAMGTNDDTTLMQGLLDAGWRVFLPPTTNYTFARLAPTNNSGIHGQGTVAKFKTGITNAPMIDFLSNTNIEIYGLALEGQYLGGSALGVSNRIGIAPYAYGRGNSIHDVSVSGFDYGIKPTGDKTTTTSHQSPTLKIYSVNTYSNYMGVDIESPDGSHVVEYLTISMLNSFYNTWGIVINAGNINLIDSDLNNNDYGLGIPGSGVNNSHGSIVGSKINHNTTAAFAITNVTSGELLVGNQINANGSAGFISASKGIRISNNRISGGNIFVAQGNDNGPNFIDNNNGDTYGGGSGPFTVLDYDGSVRHYNNMAIADKTGDGLLFFRTNFPVIGNGFDMPETNAFTLVNSNGVTDMWFSINDGSGTRLDQPIALRKPRTTAKNANFSVLTTDTGTLFNNSTASISITNTLPAAVAGLNYGFTVIVATNLSVKAVGSDTIRNVTQVTGAAGGVACATIGAHINVFCPVAGQWIIASTNTTWTTF